ncbi:c-type cytochrome [Maliponia aquimaris]|nr:cytochrome c [Maliponia aquimaris]
MNKILLAGAVAVFAAAAGYLYTSRTGPDLAAPDTVPGGAIVTVALPETLTDQERMGKTAFEAVCAACHGENAAGKQGFGPPLVHRIYEPSHHADMAFHLAAERGVRAHHWTFGDMPPQPGLTRADVTAIVAYVRTLQRANGIM